jgi:lipopolysaccharide/colanic/teichoic acid biosynthesis glycosyltransferase
MINRVIDIIVSIVGLLLLLLFLPFIALIIKLDSKGPIFYACHRVGLNGKIFQMYKFRSMYDRPVDLGPSLSPRGDPRVTAVGRLLRRLKLNELPQFINVLKGDMTLIGPRPEAPDLAQAYPEYARKIFTIKPGLVGPNQILGRNEEEIFPPEVDPVKYYIEQLLPRKIAVDLQYVDDKSILKDLRYLFLGAKVTVTEAFTRRHLLENWSQIFMLVCDACLCFLSFTLALYIRFGDATNQVANIQPFVKVLPLAIVTRIPIFIYLGFYHTLIRHLSFYDLKRVIKGVALGSVVLVAVTFLCGFMNGYSRAVFVIDWLCLTSLLIVYRIMLMTLHQRYVAKTISLGKVRNVIIWGAGDAGELCLQYLQKAPARPYKIVGFIDDNPQKLGKRIGGAKILGTRYHLGLLAKLYQIQEVFVAIPSAPRTEIEKILDICGSLGLSSISFLAKSDVHVHPAESLRHTALANGYLTKEAPSQEY